MESKKLPVLYAACDDNAPISGLIGPKRDRLESYAAEVLTTRGVVIEPYIPVARVRERIAELDAARNEPDCFEANRECYLMCAVALRMLIADVEES